MRYILPVFSFGLVIACSSPAPKSVADVYREAEALSRICDVVAGVAHDARLSSVCAEAHRVVAAATLLDAGAGGQAGAAGQ